MDPKSSPSKFKDILLPKLVSGSNSSGQAVWTEISELSSSFGIHVEDGGHGVVRDADGRLNCTGKFSVVAWVRFDPKQGTLFEQCLGSIVSKHGPGAGWELRGDQSKFQFLVTLHDSQKGTKWHEVVEVPYNGSSKIGVQGWCQLAGTFDGYTLMAYVNGKNSGFRRLTEDALEIHKDLQIVNYSGSMGIGCNPHWSNRYVNGDICGIRIYTDRVLSGEDLITWLA